MAAGGVSLSHRNVGGTGSEQLGGSAPAPSSSTTGLLGHPHSHHSLGRGGGAAAAAAALFGIGPVHGSMMLWLICLLGWLSSWFLLHRDATDYYFMSRRGSLPFKPRLPNPDLVLAVFSPDTPAGSAKRDLLRRVYSVYEGGLVKEAVSPRALQMQAQDDIRSMELRVVFIIGTMKLDRVGLHGDELFVAAEPGYDRISELTLGMTELVDHFDFQYLIKSDDDTIICMRRLVSKLLEVPAERRSRLYAGVPTYCGVYPKHPNVGKVFDDPNSKWYDAKFVSHTMGALSCYPIYMQGAMYLLGREMADFVHGSRELLTTFTNEDVTMGTWLLGVDREILALDEFNNPTNGLWNCKCALQRIPRPAKEYGIFFHDCKTPEQLQLCQEVLSSDGLSC
jgi:hypothetical protein